MMAGLTLSACKSTSSSESVSPSAPAPADSAAADSAATDSTAAAADGSEITVIKCTGVALKGHNDCGAFDGSHSCSGQATADFDPNEWVYVPKGPLCEKWGGTPHIGDDGQVLEKAKPAGDFLASDATGEEIEVVKCLSIARQGHNDCGALDGSHDCSGQAKQDLDPNEWVYVPQGPLCEKWGGNKLEKDGDVLVKTKPADDFVAS